MGATKAHDLRPSSSRSAELRATALETSHDRSQLRSMTDSLLTSILVSGSDAKTFLQGQLSCDVDTIARGKPQLASLNSAQGRVQAVLTLMERDAGMVLFVVASMAEKTVQRLRKYVLRSKVKIEIPQS